MFTEAQIDSKKVTRNSEMGVVAMMSFPRNWPVMKELEEGLNWMATSDGTNNDTYQNDGFIVEDYNGGKMYIVFKDESVYIGRQSLPNGEIQTANVTISVYPYRCAYTNGIVELTFDEANDIMKKMVGQVTEYGSLYQTWYGRHDDGVPSKTYHSRATVTLRTADGDEMHIHYNDGASALHIGTKIYKDDV